MKRSFLLALTLMLRFCFAAQMSEDEIIQQHSLINVEGLPTAMVGGCVNAITGDFIDSEKDLVISRGPESIDITRTYTSSTAIYSANSDLLGFGWELDQLRTAYVDHSGGCTFITEILGSGATHSYIGRSHEKYFKINYNLWEKGLTNTSGFFPSGKTNLGNTKFHYKEGKWNLTSGSGENFQYEHKENAKHRLASRTLPSSFQCLYHYDNTLLRRIELNTPNNEQLASICLDPVYHNKVITSGKKEVKWNFSKIDKKQLKTSSEYPVLTSVERNFAPKLEYKYKPYYFKGKSNSFLNAIRMVEKRYPENRFTEISYYSLDTPNIFLGDVYKK